MTTLKVTVRQDDAYRAVFADGATMMATKVETLIYSCESTLDLVRDLHTLIQSARQLADEPHAR